MRIKNPLIVFSFVLNIVFIAVFILAFNTRTAIFSFYNPGKNYITSALILSVLPSNSVIFNPVEIKLEAGQRVTLQMSVASVRQQANWLLTPLFDHEVLSVQPSGFGIIITAITQGESALQILTENGIRTIAVVRVL